MPPSLNDDEGEVGSQPAVMGIGGDGGGGGGVGAGQQVWVTRDGPDGKQVWSLTQFYSVDFSQSRIGVKKFVFNKRTIKVCVSCC